MGVNPFPRRDHDIFKGWYVSASHQKALQVIRRIAPFLKDPSKKRRAEKILRSFENIATIKGNQTTAEFFSECPLPTRWRERKKTYDALVGQSFQRGGQARSLERG